MKKEKHVKTKEKKKCKFKELMDKIIAKLGLIINTGSYFVKLVSNITQRIKQNISDNAIKRNPGYTSFSPKKNIRRDNENINMLRLALKDKNNRNIAISGKYGAGKSSIIRSFFNNICNKFKYKPLYISLGMFEIDENIKEVEEFSQQIEKSIIQQILYSEMSVNVPDSNINRITKLRAKHIKDVVLILISIGLISWFAIKGFNIKLLVNDVNRAIEKTLQHIGKLNIDLIIAYIKNISLVDIVTIGIVTLAIVCIVVFLANIYRKFRIKVIKIGVKDTVIELGRDNDGSLISKYLNELVYFFSKTKYKTVIIEDLDRFIVEKISDKKSDEESKIIKQHNQKILIIFQKLKELNEVLNNSKEIKNDIKFLYAVKDDIFSQALERTKFFDFIIPVIPILGTYNSYAQLEEKIKRVEKILKMKSEDMLDKNLIKDLATHINDYRLMSSIINEYVFYLRYINREKLDKNKLFAMIVLKNINPKEYDDLMNDDGKIYKLLNATNELIKLEVSEKKDKIDNNNKRIKEIREETLNSFNELKMLVLGNLTTKEISSYTSGGLTPKQFLDDSITIDYIEDNEINIYYSEKRGRYDERDVFENNKSDFLKRARTIEAKNNNEINKLREENISIKKEIDSLKRKKISELLISNKEFVKNQNIDLNGLEYKLVVKDYIDHNYQAYMYKFKSTTEHTLVDETFMYNNIHYNSLPFNYELINPKEVVNELELKFFGIKNILNHSLTYFLLQSSEKEHIEKKEELMKLLTGNIDTDDEELIINYIYDYMVNKEGLTSSKMMRELNSCDANIISKMLSTFMDSAQEKYDYIIRVLMNCPDLLVNEQIKSEISDYILQLSNFETWIELNDNIKSSLKILDIQFEELDKQKGQELIKFIYDENMYICNSNMIGHIFKYLGYEYKEFDLKNFSLIMNEIKLSKVKEYILDNKNQYIEQCYLKTNNMENNIDDINEIINTWNIGDSLKEAVVRRIGTKVDEITKIVDLKNYDWYFENNKIEANWENVYYYYKDLGLTHILIEFIENNIEQLLSTPERKVVNRQELVNMWGMIIKNKNIKFETFERLVLALNVRLGRIDEEEIEEQRLKVLISNANIKVTVNNFNIISKEVLDMLDKYISSNIEEFIVNISKYELDDEKVSVIIKSDEIRYKDKTRIIQGVNCELLNEDTLEYIINNYNKTKIAKLSREIKEHILTSAIDLASKVKFLNIAFYIELSDSAIINYLELMGEPYSMIGRIELRNTKISIPKYEETLAFVRKLQQSGLRFTYKEHKGTVTINNIKNISNT